MSTWLFLLLWEAQKSARNCWCLYGVQNCGEAMIDEEFNVASNCCLPGRVDEFWTRFAEAGYADEDLPEVDGWMRTEVFSGYVVGRIAIRDQFGDLLFALTERNGPYCNQQKRNFLQEGKVLEHCEWPVMSVPMISEPMLAAIAEETVLLKPRRGMTPRFRG